MHKGTYNYHINVKEENPINICIIFITYKIPYK